MGSGNTHVMDRVRNKSTVLQGHYPDIWQFDWTFHNFVRTPVSYSYYIINKGSRTHVLPGSSVVNRKTTRAVEQSAHARFHAHLPRWLQLYSSRVLRAVLASKASAA